MNSKVTHGTTAFGAILAGVLAHQVMTKPSAITLGEAPVKLGENRLLLTPEHICNAFHVPTNSTILIAVPSTERVRTERERALVGKDGKRVEGWTRVQIQ